RIGTRVPIFVPQRVTPELVAMLRKYHPFYMSLHFNHAKEVAPDVAKACMMLADGGIPLGSQTVLLKGVNDRPEVLKKLFHELLKIRVRPYYLFQCDLVVGSEHLRTTVDKGIEIIEKLRGHTTGYAVPTYVVDLPGGGGKIPVQPEYAVAKGDGKWVFRNYEGKTFEYYDPFSEGKKVKTQNGRTSKNGRTAKVVGL
ncbi:MAG: lysine 2,3-aminomutase, partial [Candidatus Tectomicrobia bacterium]|nr:lysine 2,3-aminomutase [Candidatus Tectomicrobia bacterium]